MGSCYLPTPQPTGEPHPYAPSPKDEQGPVPGVAVPVKSFSVLAFEDRILVDDSLVERGSLPWLLREHSRLIFPAWLVAGWRGSARGGRAAWPAPLLFALLLLRHSEAGLSRVGAVRRASTDAVWRAALRLPWTSSPPDEKTLREFEAFLREPHASVKRPRFEVAFEHWTRLCLERPGFVADAVWMIDSTPMWCFGAVLDTIRLLGDGLRSLGKRWARARKADLTTVALEWKEPLLLARSTKGYFEGTDWSDDAARSRTLAKLAETVTRVTELVIGGLGSVRENKREPLARLARNLVRVVGEDLEADESGAMQVVERTTSARLISYTDPEAQHFRKTKSKVCSGFKLHALGDAVSGLVLSLSVTPGGAHDSTQLHPLVARARELHGDLRELLADAAYGGVGVRVATRDQHGVTVVAPPVANSSKGAGLGKEDFAIDFEAMRATCPGGVATSQWKMAKEGESETPMFTWSKESSTDCACADKCPVHRDRRRHLKLHPLERELRNIRAEWEKPATRKRYRRRTEGERLMREMTRRGARRGGRLGPRQRQPPGPLRWRRPQPAAAGAAAVSEDGGHHQGCVGGTGRDGAKNGGSRRDGGVRPMTAGAAFSGHPDGLD